MEPAQKINPEQVVVWGKTGATGEQILVAVQVDRAARAVARAEGLVARAAMLMMSLVRLCPVVGA
ncbi:hypothetical protein LAV78_20280 [Brucella intermedia]|uniref:hypothetical protein n=1 Tax=Brucella intermedia TaxID=94625 RepID=UPI0013AFF7F6|nr:hypothetical protein [Brucella intermedia]MCB4920859.1 hypothetical protein [Brucella intermedia]